MPSVDAAARASGRYVLARSLCRFRHFSWPAAATAQSRAVLRNLLLAWAPFDDAQYFVVLRSDGAMAWACDATAVTRRISDAGLTSPPSLWPEPLLVEPSRADGLRLLQGVEGVEGQWWQAGMLMASRWWSAPPDDAEWGRWVAALPQGFESGTAARPEPQSPRWRNRPWADPVDIDALLSTSSSLERVVVGTALVALAGLGAAQFHQAWAAHDELEARSVERARLAAAVAPVVAARERALVMAAQAQGIAAQMSAVLPLELLQHLSERLPRTGVVLRELELTGLRLRIALELAPEVARATVVKELQAGGWLSRVTETRDTAARGWVWFEMDVEGVQPSPGAVAAAVTSTSPPQPGLPVPEASGARR